MRIRQMTAEDIPAVAQIEKECFSQPWSEQGFLDGMKDAIFFVAEDPQIAGYIGMYRMPPEGEITNVAVTRKMRKKGCGRELLLRMQQWADEHGIDRIILEVRSGNEPAIHLYRTCGFEKIGVRKNFYQFPREDAILWSGNDYVRCMFVRNCRNDAAAVPVADITYAQI